ncbi:CD164 sialomucin-like 2 protein [Cyrtonyx montezumae]|uniref:CD164 sialomucin-like 2 protein n=1 Tax=Cyrtonyx montezumae TaxID=9017 RepID=UPI0032DB2104
MPPPRSGALRCAVLCAVLCAQGTAATRAECGELRSCELCTAAPPAPNGTACVWGGCGAPETWSCVRSGGATWDICVLYNSSALCPAALKSPTKEPPPPPSKEPATRPPPPHGPTGSGPTDAPLPGFHAASFVGGAVLVLGTQAALFFILRFIRSKDSAYRTLEDNQ